MPLFVNNQTEKAKLDNNLTETLETVVQTVLKTENRNDDPEVSLVLVDDDYIRELNNTYRNKDSATDVLSFAMEESTGEEPLFEAEEDVILGDIIISVETAERQAKEYGHSFVREMAFLTTHGMLHLLGYDHEVEEKRTVMREREEQILSLLNISR